MTFLLKTPYVFDVSIQDLFTAFCAGGTLIIAEPGAHKDAGAIAEVIQSKCLCAHSPKRLPAGPLGPSV